MSSSKFLASAICFTSVFLAGASQAHAHCQVPCGIYDDAARIQSLKEDAKTMEKAVVQINELAAKTDAQSKNQLSRWVHAKEEHGSNIIKVVAEYFLTQKVKPKAKTDAEYAAYQGSLVEHHAVLHAAMKVKQTVDTANVEKLKAAIGLLEKRYGGHSH